LVPDPDVLLAGGDAGDPIEERVRQHPEVEPLPVLAEVPPGLQRRVAADLRKNVLVGRAGCGRGGS